MARLSALVLVSLAGLLRIVKKPRGKTGCAIVRGYWHPGLRRASPRWPDQMTVFGDGLDFHVIGQMNFRQWLTLTAFDIIGRPLFRT